MRIGRALLGEKKPRGFVKEMAQRVEVTSQTMRNWRRGAASKQTPKIGRPRHTEERRSEVARLVAVEMERQKNPGWRPIAMALPGLPVRLVQDSVARIKRERIQRIRKEMKMRRTKTTVLAKEAVWSIDGLQTPQPEENLHSQAIKDRGSLAYRAVESGGPFTAGAVVEILDAMPNLPLVLASDNDKIYCGTVTTDWMREKKIVHLRSLPRTPQHNGTVEIAIRSLKEAAEGSGESLAEIAQQLNECRLRASKGYQTSAQLDAVLPAAESQVAREVFYEKCMDRLRRVADSPMKWREKRLVEREVIYATLEEYGLIKQTGGEGSLCRGKSKIFL
jgi:transposase InsO family protein